MLGAKGLAGGLRIEVLTDYPDRFAPGEQLWLEGEAASRVVTAVAWLPRGPVVSLAGISNRTDAEALTGRFLEATPRPLPDGSYFWHQLVGLRVSDVAGRQLGTLAEVFRAGGGEVYRIEGDDGELLVPALGDVVQQIDLEAGTMTVRYEPEEVA